MHIETSDQERTTRPTHALWRMALGMAQITLATAALLLWLVHTPTPLVAALTLATALCVVASLLLWRGR